MKVLLFIVCCIWMPANLQTIVTRFLAASGVFTDAIGAGLGAGLVVIVLFGGGFILKNKIRDAWEDSKNSIKYVEAKLQDESIADDAKCALKKQLNELNGKHVTLSCLISLLVVVAFILSVVAFAVI